MKTTIIPTQFIPGRTEGDQVPGFYVGREFVPMNPHKGHVGLLPTSGLRYRFCKGGNNKNAQYAGQHYELVIRTIDQPVTENELLRVAASNGERLVILDNRKNKPCEA